MHRPSSALDAAIAAVDAAHVQVATAQRGLLAEIAALEPDRDWQQWGARNAAH